MATNKTTERYSIFHKPSRGYYLGKDEQGEWVPYRVHVKTKSTARALREALLPFANLDVSMLEGKPDDYPILRGPDESLVTLGDIRRAKALCSK